MEGPDIWKDRTYGRTGHMERPDVWNGRTGKLLLFSFILSTIKGLSRQSSAGTIYGN
jgi:hypothetical protein